MSKNGVKGYPLRQKVMPKGPDQASICDELGMRMCFVQSYGINLMPHIYAKE